MTNRESHHDRDDGGAAAETTCEQIPLGSYHQDRLAFGKVVKD